MGKHLLSKLLVIFLCLMGSSSIFAQATITVKGIIKDETGYEIIGATILEEGTTNGTVSDVDGRYSITVKSGASLRFSFIGYQSQTIKATSEKIDVVLREDAQILEESVVIGYSARGYSDNSYYAYESPREKYIPTVPLKPQSRKDGEKYTEIKENQFIKVKDEALSTFSADVDKASYSNMKSYINGGVMPPQDAIRYEEMINYFKYDYEAPTDGEPVKFHTEVGNCPWNRKARLVKIGLKARETGISKDGEDLPQANLVFLIDVSGSMSGATRIDLVKASMKLLLDQLRPDDRVAIVTYANGVKVNLESTAARNKEKIKRELDALYASGGTSGGRGIQLAYEMAEKNFVKGGNNRIVLCTDGDFNIGISNTTDLKKLIEEKRETGVFLSVFGYGIGNYRDDMMQTLSKAGNGNYAYINDMLEANKVMVDEFHATMYTIAKDVKLQVEFNPLKVDSYRLIGYELRLLDKEDFNDDAKDAGDMGIGHTVTAFYEVIPVGTKIKKGKKEKQAVDPLKYQMSTPTGSDELLTVKMRYKDPDGDESRMVSKAVIDGGGNEVSDDFRFASAVAYFGKMLREDNKYDIRELDRVRRLASGAYGKDEDGYRREFVRLVKLTEDIVISEAE